MTCATCHVRPAWPEQPECHRCLKRRWRRRRGAAWAGALLTLTTGCAAPYADPYREYPPIPHRADAPDSRHADVVVETPALEYSVAQAVDFWANVSMGAVEMRPALACTRLPCVRIRWSDAGLKPEDAARWRPLDEEREHLITVRPGRISAPTIAHELGHVLWLPHVDGSTEVMYSDGGQVAGPGVRKAYETAWGEPAQEWWIE